MLSRHLRDKFVAVHIDNLAKRRVLLVESPLRLPRGAGARHPRTPARRRRARHQRARWRLHRQDTPSVSVRSCPIKSPKRSPRSSRVATAPSGRSSRSPDHHRFVGATRPSTSASPHSCAPSPSNCSRPSAATTIHGRVVDAVRRRGQRAHDHRVGPTKLHAAGLSRTKAQAMVDLATRRA
jgi:hypothetical protein